MIPRPDMLDARSPAGLELFQLTAGPIPSGGNPGVLKLKSNVWVFAGRPGPSAVPSTEFIAKHPLVVPQVPLMQPNPVSGRNTVGVMLFPGKGTIVSGQAGSIQATNARQQPTK